MFDAAVLGNWLTVLQILAIVVGGWIFLIQISKRFYALELSAASFALKIAQLDLKLEKFNDSFIALAKQEARMDAIDSRLQELSNRLEATTEPVRRRKALR